MFEPVLAYAIGVSLATMLFACAFAFWFTRVGDQEPITSRRCAFENCVNEGTVPMRSLFSNTIGTVCDRCAEESEANGWAVRA